MKADTKQIIRLLNTAKGQINGILKMIEDDEYCIDISNQIMASIGILNKANKEVIKAHLESCIKDVMPKTNETDKKIEEIVDTINKLAK